MADSPDGIASPSNPSQPTKRRLIRLTLIEWAVVAAIIAVLVLLLPAHWLIDIPKSDSYFCHDPRHVTLIYRCGVGAILMPRHDVLPADCNFMYLR